MIRKQRLIKAIAFATIGVLSIVFAFICIDGMYRYEGYGYDYTRYEYYGGDAYTGMQNASADAANNAATAGRHISSTIISQGRIIQKCFGFVLLIVGLTLVVIGADGAIEFFKELREKKQKVEKKELDEQNPIM